MYRPSLSDLEAVLAISRRASFRQAALDLGLSPTALSSAIGKLEAQLGVRLFNRTTRSVALSDAGRAFVDAIGPALDDISAAMQAARASQETPSGTLRINAFPEAADTIAPLVLAFLRRYPDVHINLVTEGRLVDIVAEGFDLGLRAQQLVPSDMIAVPLGPPRRHAVVGAPAYFERHPMPLTPTDLLAHRCIRIRLPNGALFRWPFEKSGETHLLDVTGPSPSTSSTSPAPPSSTASAWGSSWNPPSPPTSPAAPFTASSPTGPPSCHRSASTTPTAATPPPHSGRSWRWRDRGTARDPLLARLPRFR